MTSKLYCLLMLFLPFCLQAQDPHFSQFHLATLDINPANTGRLDTRSQLTTIYRSQWNTVLGSQAYHSAYAAFESQITCFNNRFFAIGITGKFDRVGDIKLTRSYGYGSFAYHHGLSKNQFLSAGFQLGLIDFSMQTDGLQFDEQFDGIGFNGSLPTFEDGTAFGNTVMDFNVGLSYYDTERRFTLGMALFHVLQPNYSFFDDENYRLGMGLALHGETFNLNGTLGLRTIFRKQSVINNKQWYALIMPTFGLPNRNKNTPPQLQLSVGPRIGGTAQDGFVAIDALLINILFKKDSVIFSVNYDLNISPLSKASNTVGGLELAMVLPFGNEKRACVKCPAF